jgi:uncharacterized protein
MSASEARVARGGPAEAPAASGAALSLASRLAKIDWDRIGAELDGFGAATTGVLLTPEECAAIASGYGQEEGFRSRVVMSRHGFGRGEYKYYAYPLPNLIAEMREALYPPLAAIANRWEAALGRPGDFPKDHAAYLDRCHAAGQTRPTPLLLRYETGDYNCLHQDLYGALAFPLQIAFLLSGAGRAFHWRRVRAHRAAPAHAVARRGRVLAPR